MYKHWNTNKTRLWITRIFIYAICIILLALSVVPFTLMLVNATRSTEQIQQGLSIIPSHFAPYNWSVLERMGINVFRGFLNSLTISVGATFLTLYFSALTAYAMVIYNFKGRKLFFAFIALILMIPTQISMIGFYRMMLNLELVDTYVPLILPAIATPATVFFMRQYLLSVFPVELVQAARIDGASELRIFHTIAIPIMKPALATMGIFAFVTSWNNFLMPLMLLSTESKFTLPMLVQLLRADIFRTEMGSIYLGISMTIAPLLVIYLIFSKYIVAGVAMGGVKE